MISEGMLVSITKLQLFGVALFVSVFLGIVAALNPDTLQQNLLVVMTLFVLGAAFSFTITSVQESIKKSNKSSKWLQPVPTTVLVFLINLIVVMWLCVIGLLFFLALATASGQTIVFCSLILVLFGAALGRHFQNRFSSKTLVPYGGSFGVALMLLLVLQRLIG